MNKSQTRVYVRKFLNKPKQETHAFILADCSAYGSEPWKNEKKSGIRSPRYDGYVPIGDCSRTVTLDFNVSDHSHDFENGVMSPDLKKEYANVHQKVAVLHKTFGEILQQLEGWKQHNFQD